MDYPSSTPGDPNYAIDVDPDPLGTGDPGYGAAPDTQLTDYNVNQLTFELMGVVEKAGVTPDATNVRQVSTYIGDISRASFGNDLIQNITVNAPTTLGNDISVNNLTVEVGGSIDTNGYRIFCRNKLQIDIGGEIISYGGDGQDGSAGGAGGAGTVPGSVGRGGGGGNGVADGDGQVGVGNIYSLGGAGGAGGVDAGLVNNGGVGGTVTVPPDEAGTWQTHATALTGEVRGFGGQGWLTGGAGGGSGASDGGLVTSGGGGGGGGVILICAHILENNGTIAARGGIGGIGQGIAGGGGGGGGGLVLIARRTLLPGTGTIDVSGGDGGASAGGGATGVTGSDGTIVAYKL